MHPYGVRKAFLAYSSAFTMAPNGGAYRQEELSVIHEENLGLALHLALPS